MADSDERSASMSVCNRDALSISRSRKRGMHGTVMGLLFGSHGSTRSKISNFYESESSIHVQGGNAI